jgi:hypothetical protein
MEEPRTHLGHEDGSASEAAEEARRGEPAASSASGGGEGEREERGKGRPPEKERVRVVFGSLEDIILFYPMWIGRGRDGRLGSMQRKTMAVSLCIT